MTRQQENDPFEGLWSTSVLARKAGVSTSAILKRVSKGQLVPKFRRETDGAYIFDPEADDVRLLLPKEVRPA